MFSKTEGDKKAIKKISEKFNNDLLNANYSRYLQE